MSKKMILTLHIDLPPKDVIPVPLYVTHVSGVPEKKLLSEEVVDESILNDINEVSPLNT